MGFFDKAKDTFREKTRDKVYTALKSIGVDAKLAENGRPEEIIKCGFGIHLACPPKRSPVIMLVN